MQDYEGSDSSSPGFDYEDSAPVVPRGGPRNARSMSPAGYEESVSAPVILRGTAKRNGQSAGTSQILPNASYRDPNLIQFIQNKSVVLILIGV